IEHLSGMDRAVPHEIDELRQEATCRRRATVQVYVAVEEIRAAQLDPMRDADEADGPARPCRVDRLHHRLRGPDALEHRVGTDAVRDLLDPCDTFVTAFGDDVGRAELTGEPLPRFVAAHREDALRAHQLR